MTTPSQGQETTRDDRLRERFVRWQSNTARQFSFINNLVVGLSVAALGFALDRAAQRFRHAVVQRCTCRYWRSSSPALADCGVQSIA